jgi:CBS domain containing-hemolysin-like protein
MWISYYILNKFFNVKGDHVQLSFSKVELGNFINEQMEVTNSEEVDSEIQIFQNALEFGDLKAREVMVPRSEITAVSVDEEVDNLTEIFTRTGFSKILVYKESKDNIIGYVHSFEMFKQPSSTKDIFLPVIYVPETASAKDVLNMLTKKRMSIAVVIDEYGGTSGMMTVEDIVEELFGEIEDEHDPVQLKEEQIAENHFIFAARLEVDYLNETYKLNLPRSENYETLGGFVVYHAEDILEEKDEITIENFHITILEATRPQLQRLPPDCQRGT